MGFRYEYNSIKVFDRDRSVDFYEHALGMKKVHSFSPPSLPELELIFMLEIISKERKQRPF